MKVWQIPDTIAAKYQGAGMALAAITGDTVIDPINLSDVFLTKPMARIKIVGDRARHRTFSVKKYGERQAYNLALKARQQMLAGVVEKPYLYAETARQFERHKARRRIGTA